MTKTLLSTIPLMQGAALVDDSEKLIKKKKKSSMDFVKKGTKDIIGLSLIGATANAIDEF